MNTEIDKKSIIISIDKYKEITGCADDFKDSSNWDYDHGLEITKNASGNYNFIFNIVNPQKFFLAQIKYGL
jgi:hypothetical protein